MKSLATKSLHKTSLQNCRRSQKDPPVLGEVGPQATRRRAKEDEDRAESGDEQQGIPQHRELLAKSCLAGLAGGPAAEISDVGGNQRHEADRDAGEEPTDEGQAEITDH